MSQRGSTPENLTEPMVLTARCRTRGGTVTDLEVVDLTIAGCMVATQGLPLKPDQRVLIKLRPLEVLPGVVRWVDEHHAGIEFDRMLYQPVLDHLRRMFLL